MRPGPQHPHLSSLMVSYWRMAQAAETTDAATAPGWWRKAFEQLDGMKRRGIMILADEEYLATLREKADMASDRAPAQEQSADDALAQLPQELIAALNAADEAAARGEHEQALAGFEAVRAAFAQLDNAAGELQMLMRMGVSAQLMNDTPRALDLFARAAQMARSRDDTQQKAMAIFNIADAQHAAGALDAAEPLYAEALALADPVVDFKGLLGLAMLQDETGRHAEAHATFARCAELCRERAQGATTHYPAYTLALALLGLGEVHASLAAFEDAFAVRSDAAVLQAALQDLAVMRRGRPDLAGADRVEARLKRALGDAE